MKRMLLMAVACLMLIAGGCSKPDYRIRDNGNGTYDVFEKPASKTEIVLTGIGLVVLALFGGSSGR